MTLKLLLVRPLVTLAVLAFGLGAASMAASPVGRVAVISDIHFDPFASAGLAPRLAGAKARDWLPILSAAPRQTISSYGRDTDFTLLTSAVGALAKSAADADLVLVPGDFLAHEFEKKAADALGPAAPDQVAGLTIETTIFVADALAEALPGKPIILSLGNNDSSCGDYRIEPGGNYLAATMETVRRLAGADRLDPDFAATYSAGGYYALRHPTVEKGVIIVVNDVLWSKEYENACGTNGLEPARAEMAWLARRLAAARSAGDRVWLVHHIPAGIDPYATIHHDDSCPVDPVPFLRAPFAAEFVDLIETHADIIAASFVGHVHFDDYRIIADQNAHPFALEKVVPAISPIFGQNPAFQIFTYDPATARPLDFSTIHLANLDAVSAGVAPAWRVEYSFEAAYGMPYSVEAMAAIDFDLASAGPRAQTFRRLYNVGHGALKAGDLPAYICAIGHVRSAGFGACYCGG